MKKGFSLKSLVLGLLALAGWVVALLDTAFLGRAALLEGNPFLGERPMLAPVLASSLEGLVDRAGRDGCFPLREGDLFKLVPEL